MFARFSDALVIGLYIGKRIEVLRVPVGTSLSKLTLVLKVLRKLWAYRHVLGVIPTVRLAIYNGLVHSKRVRSSGAIGGTCST